MSDTCDLSGWAGNLLLMLGDTTTSTGSVVTWMKTNLYQLNVSLNKNFAVSGDCITPGLSTNESGIYSEMYLCYTFRRGAHQSVGAMGCDWVQIKGDGQGAIIRNPGATAKAANESAKDCYERLNKLICWHNARLGSGMPQQVLYNTRAGVSYYGRIAYPPAGMYSPYNPIWRF